MGAVAFHSGVADKLAYACRLVRKAWRGGQRVLVTGPADQLARLDALMWTFELGEFLPHVRLRAGQVLAPHLARTPVLLAEQPDAAGVCEVLVNLGPGPVVGAAGFDRVIELVASGEDEVLAGRQRWRQYLAAGVKPTSHKVDAA